jgi:hypothetical protein
MTPLILELPPSGMGRKLPCGLERPSLWLWTEQSKNGKFLWNALPRSWRGFREGVRQWWGWVTGGIEKFRFTPPTTFAVFFRWAVQLVNDAFLR